MDLFYFSPIPLLQGFGADTFLLVPVLLTSLHLYSALSVHGQLFQLERKLHEGKEFVLFSAVSPAA